MVQRKKPTFEEALAELEEITHSLEGGDLSLDDPLTADGIEVNADTPNPLALTIYLNRD